MSNLEEFKKIYEAEFKKKIGKYFEIRKGEINNLSEQDAISRGRNAMVKLGKKGLLNGQGDNLREEEARKIANEMIEEKIN